MTVGELFQAVQSAERAVQLKPNWSIVYQTLGRAQLGIGEIKMVRLTACIVHMYLNHVSLKSKHYYYSLSLSLILLKALVNFQKSLHIDPSNEEVSCLFRAFTIQLQLLSFVTNFKRIVVELL